MTDDHIETQERVLWPHVEPYPVQVEAVDAAEAMLAEHGSALVVLPTGLGKTVCFAELARRYWEGRGERVLVIAHTEELIEQAAEKIHRFGGIKTGIEMAQRSVDLHGLYPPAVVIASVQSLSRPNRLARYPANTFGLVVIDEAHHATATTYRKIVDHFRGSVFDEAGLIRLEYTESTHLLGVTATPDRRDRRALSDLFAEVAFTYEIRDAIRDKHLVPINVITSILPELDLSGVRMVAGDLNQGQLDEALKPALHPAAVKVAVHAGIRQTLAFLPSVATAHAFAQYLIEEGMSAKALDGASPKEHRRMIVDQFRSGEIQALCNCALFTEGFDVPEISCVAILRPTTSRALYAQMIGRGTRLAEGKEDLLVLDMPGVGCDPKFKLVTPIDALGGITDEDILAKARALLEAAGLDPEDVFGLLDQAECAVQEDREKAAAEKLRRGKKLQKLDLLGRPDERAGQPRWVSQLEQFGLQGSEIPADTEDGAARAAHLISMLRDRRLCGLCTWKQAKWLRKHGLPTSVVPIGVASRWMDNLQSHRWRCVDEWVREEAAEFWAMDSARGDDR